MRSLSCPTKRRGIGLESPALEGGAAQLEWRAGLGLGDDAAKPPLHKRTQRDPFALSKLASLAKKRIRDFNGRLHDLTYGIDDMGAHTIGCCGPGEQVAVVFAPFGVLAIGPVSTHREPHLPSPLATPCGSGAGGEGSAPQGALRAAQRRCAAPHPAGFARHLLPQGEKRAPSEAFNENSVPPASRASPL